MNVDEMQLRAILREELDAKFDVKFAESEERLEAKLESKLDEKLSAKFAESEARLETKLELTLDEKLDLKFAEFFGKSCRYLDGKMDSLQERFDTKYDRLQTSLDGILGRLDTDDVERAAMSAQLTRHDAWIRKLSAS